MLIIKGLAVSAIIAGIVLGPSGWRYHGDPFYYANCFVPLTILLSPIALLIFILPEIFED